MNKFESLILLSIYNNKKALYNKQSLIIIIIIIATGGILWEISRDVMICKMLRHVTCMMQQ